MDHLHQITHGLFTGLALALIWLYALRPVSTYPKWMLAGYKYPWLVIAYLFLLVWAWRWNRIVAVCIALLWISIVLDVGTFGVAPKIDADDIEWSWNKGMSMDPRILVHQRQSDTAVFSPETAATQAALSDGVLWTEPDYPAIEHDIYQGDFGIF